MKTALLFSFLLSVSFFNIATAQQVKPKFKKFLMVSYRPSGKGAKKFIRLEDYLEIDSNAIIHYRVNTFQQWYGNLSYRGTMSDTSYLVPDSLILMINAVFADGKKFERQMKVEPLYPGGRFAGPFVFISYTDATGIEHNAAITHELDIEKKAGYVLGRLWYLKFPRVVRSHKAYRNINLEALILKCHNGNRDLPEIEEPPRVRLN